MKITVDRDLCQGHAMCEVEAPEVFRVGNSAQVELLVEQPDPASHDGVRLAVKYCPTHALSIVEES
ncbi:MAG TPA: ferredoxin [Mycobacteriales bacterium]|jgi:ferredoxin|nr:ferredoxin [Mycobacteriales bacterium]